MIAGVNDNINFTGVANKDININNINLSALAEIFVNNDTQVVKLEENNDYIIKTELQLKVDKAKTLNQQNWRNKEKENKNH
jgi:hypothetical protein